MTSPQKAKGSSWERSVAQDLTKRYGETFIRAPGSGAYVGGTNSKRKQLLHEGQIRSFKGDIVPGQSFPRFNAECKSYADFPFHQLFSGTVRILETWITQCVEVADENDVNVLFMKFNRKGMYIAIQSHESLKKLNHFTYTSENHGSWLIMEYHTFWNLNSDVFKQLCH